MTNFKISLSCTNPLWWHFNLYATVVCYDADGEITGYENVVDNGAKESCEQLREPLKIESQPCDHCDLFIYVIATIFPENENVSLAPPFGAKLTVESEGKVQQMDCSVNQWGGFTLVSYRLPSL